MEIRPYRLIKRKKTREIKVGNILVGGNSPISVQSMTNTITSNIKKTTEQINSLENAGADISEFLVQMKTRQSFKGNSESCKCSYCVTFISITKERLKPQKWEPVVLELILVILDQKEE